MVKDVRSKLVCMGVRVLTGIDAHGRGFRCDGGLGHRLTAIHDGLHLREEEAGGEPGGQGEPGEDDEGTRR